MQVLVTGNLDLLNTQRRREDRAVGLINQNTSTCLWYVHQVLFAKGFPS